MSNGLSSVFATLREKFKSPVAAACCGGILVCLFQTAIIIARDFANIESRVRVLGQQVTLTDLMVNATELEKTANDFARRVELAK